MNLVEVSVGGSTETLLEPPTIGFSRAGRLSFVVLPIAVESYWPSMLAQSFPTEERADRLRAAAIERVAGVASVPDWPVSVVIPGWKADGVLSLFPWDVRLPVVPLVVAAMDGVLHAANLSNLWVVTFWKGIVKVESPTSDVAILE